MALLRVTYNLKEVEFPILSQQQGGGCFFSQQNAYHNPPTLSYINNLWPVSKGKWAAIIRTTINWTAVEPTLITEFTSGGVKAYKVVNAGVSSILLIGNYHWIVYSNNIWLTIYSVVNVSEASVFTLKETSYMLAPGTNLFKFDPAATSLDPFSSIVAVPLTGIDITQILSACAAISYIILTDGYTIYWSSPINNSNFVPDGVGDAYGAGSAKVLAINTLIVSLKETANGFLIFTEANVVEATYSGNVDNPWVFNEIDNSAGCLSNQHLPTERAIASTLYWSINGLALISQGQCSYVATEITEFLAGSIYEEYNSITKVVEMISATAEYSVQISLIGGRYYCLSCGLAETFKSFILVYDTVSKQWFRISLPHVLVLETIGDSNAANTYENATYTYAETTKTYAEGLANEINQQVNTIAIGLLGLDGVLYSVSPIHIAAAPSSPNPRILANQVVLEDIRLTQSVISGLQEVVINTSYPAFWNLTNLQPNQSVGPGITHVYAQSSEYPLTEFNLVYQGRHQLKYTQDVTGESIILSIENINSFNALSLGIKIAGRRLV